MTAPLPTVAELEASALIAWPAHEDLRNGDWIARFAGGFSRRANSIQSMNPADDESAESRLDDLRAHYAERGLPGYFRVTSLAGPQILAALDSQGWIEDDLNLVMAMPLRKIMRAVGATTQSFAPDDAEWRAVHTAMAGTQVSTEALGQILARMTAPARSFIAYDTDLKPVATSLVVNAGGTAFFLNVVVAQDMRGLGYGRAIMHAGLNWAAQHGAGFAALQVLADNENAVALYQKLGFIEQYRYQYRRYPT